MEFHNPTEFARFLSGNDLSRLDSIFIQLITCINNYSAACSCEKREDKAKLYETCNRLYTHGANKVAPRFKNEFLEKTSDRQILFYTEGGQLITIISR